MAYTHTTAAQARTELASRLDDTGMVRWVSDELDSYIREAMRTWQAFTGFWRDRPAAFNITPGAAVYDLAALSPGRTYHVTDTRLAVAIEHHLLEPATGEVWTGSEQFTAADVLHALQRRRDQFLFETGTVLTQSALAVGAGGSGRVTLADNIIDVRRLSWLNGATYTTLWREDEWALNAFSRNWMTPAVPQVYSILAPPPITLQLGPIPAAAGTLALTSVNTGAALTGGVLVGIPDDFAWVLKWGALEDLLLRDGRSQDIPRAQYCGQRWAQGIELARMATSLITVTINGSQVPIMSVFDVDVDQPSWMNAAPAAPALVAMAGLNLVFVLPSNGTYPFIADMIVNAPVPAVDADQIQIGREELDVIIDYAEHLASFKDSSLSETSEGLGNFIRLAAQYNSKIRASTLFKDVLMDRAIRQDVQVPVQEKTTK